MALKLKVEQDLKKVGLIEVFEESRALWVGFAQRTYLHVRNNFPDNAAVRRDDVAEVLVPLLRVNEQLVGYLDEQKLKQKYWVSYFVDLILDRCWAEIANQGGPG
jgi:hypothetical protein